MFLSGTVISCLLARVVGVLKWSDFRQIRVLNVPKRSERAGDLKRNGSSLLTSERLGVLKQNDFVR